MKTYVVNLTPAINIRLYFWGIALVTDAEGDEWVMGLRTFMFPVRKNEYPFLTRHLWRNWWWIGESARRWLWEHRSPKFRPFTGLVEIPKWELEFLQLETAENVLRDKEVADRCFDYIIRGLETIKDEPVNAAKLQKYLRDWKSVLIAELLERMK